MESLLARDALGALFSISVSKNQDIYQKWISLSHKLGSKLPVATISTIQSLGHFDLILRALEEEFYPTENVDLTLTLQRGLSASWVGNAYEIFRVAKNLRADDNEAKIIHDFLLLLRVPLEKYQIAQDRKLTEPLVMGIIGGEVEESQIYDKNDKLRSVLIPTRLSGRGSAEWLAIDIENKSQFWLDRVTLADRILAYTDTIKD